LVADWLLAQNINRTPKFGYWIITSLIAPGAQFVDTAQEIQDHYSAIHRVYCIIVQQNAGNKNRSEKRRAL
jgi:hypothetical protein